MKSLSPVLTAVGILPSGCVCTAVISLRPPDVAVSVIYLPVGIAARHIASLTDVRRILRIYGILCVTLNAARIALSRVPGIGAVLLLTAHPGILSVLRILHFARLSRTRGGSVLPHSVLRIAVLTGAGIAGGRGTARAAAVSGEVDFRRNSDVRAVSDLVSAPAEQ